MHLLLRGRFPSTGRSLSIHSVAVESSCRTHAVTYTPAVPRLWTDTIEAHRRTVRDATLETTAALVAEHGLRSVTMSRVAEETGIGRATLYKYFPDVEAILLAWHEQQISGHLAELTRVRDQVDDAGERLEAVLSTYALISRGSHGHHDAELAAFLHGGHQVAQAQYQLHGIVQQLLADAVETGHVRGDIAANELAHYCIAALNASATLPSKAAARRLVTVTLAGLRPPA